MELRPIYATITPGSVRAVHQFVGGYPSDPGFGRHVGLVQETLRSVGLESEIFGPDEAADIADLPAGLRPFEDFRFHAERSVLLYHALPGCRVRLEKFVSMRSEPLVVWHYAAGHSQLWRPWDAEMADAIDALSFHLRLLSVRAAIALGANRIAHAELVGSGFLGVLSAPPLVAPTSGSRRGTGSRRPEARSPGRWLAACHIAPDHGLREAVAAFALYRRTFHPDARMTIAGTPTSQRFFRGLVGYRDRLGLEDAVTIRQETVGMPELTALLDDTDLLVSFGSGEVTGAVAAEALGRDLPVITSHGDPVADLVGSGGLQLPSTDAALVATAVNRLGSDPAMSTVLSRGRSASTARLSSEGTVDLFWRAMEQVTGRLRPAA